METLESMESKESMGSHGVHGMEAMESDESMESMECQPAIHPISQPANISGPEQKGLWGQVSVSGAGREGCQHLEAKREVFWGEVSGSGLE